MRHLQVYKVSLGRSLRQRDPLALFLYVILTDHLIYKIREDARINGLVKPKVQKHKISALTYDILLAILQVLGSIEAALEVIKDFSLVSGCQLKWLKTKYICESVDTIPACLAHVQRFSGELSQVYLGLPYQEGDENKEIDKQICIRFIMNAFFL